MLFSLSDRQAIPRISSRIYPISIRKGILKWQLLRRQGIAHESEIIARRVTGLIFVGIDIKLAILETR